MTHHPRARAAALVTIVGVVSTIGCGGPYNATLTGSVTLDGAPINTGTITFTPTSEGTTAFGRIDDSGAYAVMTGRESGLTSGEYEVSVIAREKPELADPKAGPPPAGAMITPKWYSDRRQSGLTVSVSPGRNTYDIELSSEPPPGWQADRPGGRRRTR